MLCNTNSISPLFGFFVFINWSLIKLAIYSVLKLVQDRKMDKAAHVSTGAAQVSGRLFRV